MIRKLEEKDLEEVACIWLDSNIETHNFRIILEKKLSNGKRNVFRYRSVCF